MNSGDSILAVHPSNAVAQTAIKRRQVPGKVTFGSVVLLGMVCAVMPVHASELHPIIIAMVEPGGGGYVEPAGGRIVIRSHPASLYIRMRNTSEAAVLIRIRPEMAYALELKDSAGPTFTVKRKERMSATPEEDIRVELAPGAERIFPIRIDRDTWDGFPPLVAGKESKYTARIVFKTADGQTVYSEPCTLIFNIG